MAIYFDMDGVLADFRAGVEAPGADYVPLLAKDKKADDGMWEAIRQKDHFFAGLPEIPAGVALFRALMAAGEAPQVLTAIPKPCHGIVNAAADKKDWNARHLGPEVTTHICYRAEKAGFCHGPEDVLIDDHRGNIEEWTAAGGTGVLFSAGAPVALPDSLARKIGLPGLDAGQEAPEPVLV